MAYPPTFKRIMREDIPGAPEWIDPFILSLNQFFESTYRALNKALTLSENSNSQIKTITFTAGATPTANAQRFALTMTVKPKSLHIGYIRQVENTYTPLTSVPFPNWHQESGEIVIDSILGLTSGKTYEVTFILMA